MNELETGFLKEKLNESIKSGDDSFLENYKNQINQKPISDLLYNFIQQVSEGNRKKEREIRKATQLGQSTYNHILSGQKNPSRNSLLCILIALELDIDTCNRTLKKAGFNELYVKNKRDIIIYKGVLQHESVAVINDLLYKEGLELLTKE